MDRNQTSSAVRHTSFAQNPSGAGTVLAFDFGEKYTGVAVGETGVGVAHPLGLIAAQRSATRLEEASHWLPNGSPALW